MGSNPTTSAKVVNYGLVAQWLERSPVKRGVVGSSPTLTANNGRVAERFKATVLKTVGSEIWVRGFESHLYRQRLKFLLKTIWFVSSEVERLAVNQCVAGSIPARIATINSSVVEWFNTLSC